MKKRLLPYLAIAVLTFQCFTLPAQVKASLEDFEPSPSGSMNSGAADIFTYGSITTGLSEQVTSWQGISGSQVLQVQWTGKERFGGWGKGLGLTVDLDPREDYFNLLVHGTKENLPVKLTIILEEDDNGNGTFDKGADDSWRYEVEAGAGENWELVSLPLSGFKDNNPEGDGKFNVNAKEGRLLTFMVNFPDLSDQAGGKTWHFDTFFFSKGKPTGQLSTERQTTVPQSAQPLPVPPSLAGQPEAHGRPAKKAFKEWEHMGDALRSRKFLLGKNVLTANIAYSAGRFVTQSVVTTTTAATAPVSGPAMPTRPGAGPGTSTGTGTTTTTTEQTSTLKYDYELRHALVLTTRVRLFEEFYLSSTLFKNLNPRTIQIWTADYHYSFGRYNWRPKTFSYGYENFLDNRYQDTRSLGKKFLQGYYFVSYGHDLPEKLFRPLRIDKTSAFRLNYFMRYSTHYRDADNQLHGGLLQGKPVAGISARYTVARNMYVESAVFQYLNAKAHKMPWDPDYTYGFGYFDYRSFRASVTYANWVVNRFPWNPKGYEKYGILDGDLRLTLNFNW